MFMVKAVLELFYPHILQPCMQDALFLLSRVFREGLTILRKNLSIFFSTMSLFLK